VVVPMPLDFGDAEVGWPPARCPPGTVPRTGGPF